MRLLPLLGLLACAPHVPRPADSFLVAPTVLTADGPWAPAPDAPRLLPMGRWVRVGDEVSFVYFDAEGGPSAQGAVLHPDGSRTPVIRRLNWLPAAAEVLSDEAAAALGLETPPAWLASYGLQPPAGDYGRWRSDPAFAGRLHPEFPDDLEVIVASETPDGLTPEQIWVRLVACEGTRCEGVLINVPFHPPFRFGDLVAFDVAAARPGLPPFAARPGEAFPPPLADAIDRSQLPAAWFDARSWESDPSVPTADRMPPLGRWIRLGELVALCALLPEGPRYFLAWNRELVSMRDATWLPAGAEVLDADAAAALGLPDPAVVSARFGPQPAPGTWGTWRTDPALGWLAPLAADPDVVQVQLPDGAQGLLRLDTCDADRCAGTLVEAAGGAGAGSRWQFGTTFRLVRGVEGSPIAADARAVPSVTPAP